MLLKKIIKVIKSWFLGVTALQESPNKQQILQTSFKPSNLFQHVQILLVKSFNSTHQRVTQGRKQWHNLTNSYSVKVLFVFSFAGMMNTQGCPTKIIFI